MMWGADCIGVLLVASGAGLGLWKRIRVFNRTSAYGMERFGSFWSKIAAKSTDALLGGLSFLLVITGVLLLAHNSQSTWGWIVLIPAYGLLFALLLGLPITLNRHTK